VVRQRKGVPAEYRPSTDHILQVWEQATDTEITAGAEWYPRAHKLAGEIFGCPSTGAGVIAALSPQCAWQRNITLAREAARGKRGSYVTASNWAKAQRIMGGEHWTTVLGPRGPKVRAFAATIEDPWDALPVVIDRHAFDVAIGRPTSDSARQVVLSRVGVYDLFAATYRLAADLVGESPATVQATTWTTWRRLKGLPD
jgi:hypothetical protein